MLNNTQIATTIYKLNRYDFQLAEIATGKIATFSTTCENLATLCAICPEITDSEKYELRPTDAACSIAADKVFYGYTVSEIETYLNENSF